MGLNLSALVFGPLDALMVDALGASLAWWVGHLTLVGFVALIAWAGRNWSDIAYGMEINRMRIWSWLVFVGLTAGQIVLYQSTFGFPFTGAFLTALVTSGYIWWQWYQIEPAKA